MKEKSPGHFSEDVLAEADELDRAFLRAYAKGRPFVMISVGAHVLGTIIEPKEPQNAKCE